MPDAAGINAAPEALTDFGDADRIPLGGPRIHQSTPNCRATRRADTTPSSWKPNPQ